MCKVVLISGQGPVALPQDGQEETTDLYALAAQCHERCLQSLVTLPHRQESGAQVLRTEGIKPEAHSLALQLPLPLLNLVVHGGWRILSVPVVGWGFRVSLNVTRS